MPTHSVSSRNRYNLEYEFVGGGSLTTIKLSTRPNGQNHVILTNSVATPSVWLLDTNGHDLSKTSLKGSCNTENCVFSVAGVSVTVVRPEWHVVLCMFNDVVYMANVQKSAFVPFVALTAWVQGNLYGGQATLEARLRTLPNVHLADNVRLQWLPMQAPSKQLSSHNCPPSYIPSLQAIVCRSMAGVFYRSYASNTPSQRVTMTPFLYDLATVMTQTRLN
jgi:hypothetical protein